MGKPNITSASRRLMKPRGKSKFTLLMEVIKDNSLIGLSPNATTEEANKAFLAHVASRAFDVDDPASGTLLSHLLARCIPAIKAVLPDQDIGFEEQDTVEDIAHRIVATTAVGGMPPDVAAVFMSVLKDKVAIEEKGELIERLTKLEEALSKYEHR